MSEHRGKTRHVDHIAKKTNPSHDLPQRIFKLAYLSVKLIRYASRVRPKMEQASLIWDRYRANLTVILEAVQSRAARFVIIGAIL